MIKLKINYNAERKKVFCEEQIIIWIKEKKKEKKRYVPYVVEIGWVLKKEIEFRMEKLGLIFQYLGIISREKEIDFNSPIPVTRHHNENWFL